MLRDERLQLRHELGGAAAGSKVCVDRMLQRHEPQLLEPRRLVLRPGLVREVGEGRAAPELEPRAKLPRRPVGMTTRERLATLADELLEAADVEGGRIELERVPGRLGDERLDRPVAGRGGQRLPQVGDVVLYRCRRPPRRLRRPEVVDQPVRPPTVAPSRRTEKKAERRSLA